LADGSSLAKRSSTVTDFAMLWGSPGQLSMRCSLNYSPIIWWTLHEVTT
jgi:hypothetical protein